LGKRNAIRLFMGGVKGKKENRRKGTAKLGPQTNKTEVGGVRVRRATKEGGRFGGSLGIDGRKKFQKL